MIYGELCEFSSLVNYLAFEAFSKNPDLCLRGFWEQSLPALRQVTDSNGNMSSSGRSNAPGP